MFYDIYVALCQERKKKPSAVATELGINKSNVSNWKNNGYTPRGDALQRIADYFNVTTDYLLTGEEKEKPTSQMGSELDKQLEGVDFALFGEVKDLDEADKRDVLQFIQFLKGKKEKKGD